MRRMDYWVPLLIVLGVSVLSALAATGPATTQALAPGEFIIPEDIGPATPRAYVICFGASAFESTDWNLQFAAKDASAIGRSLSQSLRAAKEFDEVISVTLLSEHDAAQKVTKSEATRANLARVLEVLSGKQTPEAAVLACKDVPELAETFSKLRPATPDDLVVLAFSTHGYTAQNGVFYLLPYDIGAGHRKEAASKEESKLEALLAKCISSDDLSNWLRRVDAGQFAMIIDTCQSAGSVAPRGYKHGPFGSRGLGQLAYDKAMRVLAASAYDQLAFEPQAYGHGLLTYSLVIDGLDRGLAAVDGQLTFKRWLTYGEQRCEELRQALVKNSGQLAKSITSGQDASIKDPSLGERPLKLRLTAEEAQKLDRLRQPTLFDFARGRDVKLVPGGTDKTQAK